MVRRTKRLGIHACYASYSAFIGFLMPLKKFQIRPSHRLAHLTRFKCLDDVLQEEPGYRVRVQKQVVNGEVYGVPAASSHALAL
jgi:hypothetical protein